MASEGGLAEVAGDNTRVGGEEHPAAGLGVLATEDVDLGLLDDAPWFRLQSALGF